MVLPSWSPEDYMLVGTAHHDTVFSEFQEIGSGKHVDMDAQLMSSIRHHHPQMTVTVIPSDYANLAGYAAAGYACAELDTSSDSLLRWRFYQPAAIRSGNGRLLDAYFFVRYKYTWRNIEFIVYTIQEGLIELNYILFPPDDDETVLSHSKVTDALLQAIGEVQFAVEGSILVYDGYWTRSRALYEEVQKASWDDVILDKKMKKTLTKTVAGFFDSEKSYKDLNVPWKRGVIFYGPAGCGKTISIKALMHTLSIRTNPVICLYVKALRATSQIGIVFREARQMVPCLLILEDIDTLVTEELRSYFFNEVDGLENNNGIMMIATTNHLDRLDGGLAKRPSRFDRKYAFLAPNRDERILYCDYWRGKLQHNKSVEFPARLSPAIADITQDFTFAYLKEAFVATLLAIARPDEDDDEDDEDNANGGITNLEHGKADLHGRLIDDEDKIAHLPLWIGMQKQVKILREEMNSGIGSKKECLSNVSTWTRRPRMPPSNTGITSLASAEKGMAEQGRLVEMRTDFNRQTAKPRSLAGKGISFPDIQGAS